MGKEGVILRHARQGQIEIGREPVDRGRYQMLLLRTYPSPEWPDENSAAL